MPILTDRKSTNAYLTGAAGGTTTAVFPKDSIVMYYSNTIPYSGTEWSPYTTGQGKYICGTTTPSLLGTTTTDTTGSVNISLGTTGAHTGSVTYVSCGGYSTGSTLNDSSNLSAGAHAHSGTISYSGTYKLSPNSYNVTLLRANAETAFLPSNTIAFRNPSSGTYGTEIIPPSTGGNIGYFYNTSSSGTLTSGVTSVTGYGSVYSSGAHIHHQNIMQYYITGKLTNYWGQSAGAHIHSISAIMSQTRMDNTIVLNAYQSSTPRIVSKDVVVMYAGDPAALPAGWFICNGSNGTINMNGRYISVASSTLGSWGSLLNSDSAASSVTVSTIGSHTHVSTSNPAGAGRTLYHGTQAWSHTHTVSSSAGPYALGKLYLYFIQYKG